MNMTTAQGLIEQKEAKRSIDHLTKNKSTCLVVVVVVGQMSGQDRKKKKRPQMEGC